MRNSLKNFALAVGLLNFLIASVVASENSILVAYENRPPFQFRNENNQPAGMDIELLQAILEQAGIEAKYLLYPWKRALHQLKSGRVDLVMGAGKTAERQQYAYYSKEVFQLGYNALFMHKKHTGSGYIESLSELTQTSFKIGFELGTSYSDEFDSLSKNNSFVKNLFSVEDETEAVKLTLAGRLDGFLSNELVANQILALVDDSEEIELLFRLYAEEQAKSFLIFSKASVEPETVQRIDDAMKELYEKNGFAAIYERYQYRSFD